MNKESKLKMKISDIIDVSDPQFWIGMMIGALGVIIINWIF